MTSTWIVTTRGVPAVQVPHGTGVTLPKGSRVFVTQRLGSSITVESDNGWLLRLDAADADALGLEREIADETHTGAFDEGSVWKVLRGCYDPEIPIDIVELGLIYGCDIQELTPGKRRVLVRMTLTAPGCGMGDILKDEIEKKLAALPSVVEATVEVVLDPPWEPSRMSEAARLAVGLY
jgi:probable FeS assembly SUF system protein SufT